MDEFDDEEQARSLASKPGTWHLRRMTALPPGLKPKQRAVITDTELGLTSRARTRRPQGWRFGKVSKAKRDPRHLSFHRTKPNSLVCDTEDRVDAWLDAAQRAFHSIDNLQTADGETERPHWKRSTVQVGTVISWFVNKIGPGQDGPKPWDERTFWDVGEQLVRLFKAVRPTPTEINTYSATHPEPAETNPGYPTFGGEVSGKLVGACFIDTQLRPAEMLDFASEFAQRSGSPQEAILSYGLGGRAGPVYKWTDLPQLQGNTWATVAEWRGHAQRNRIIQMSPTCFNKPLRDIATGLKLCRQRIPGLWRHGNLDAKLLAQFPFIQEADISGYDNSVTPFLQRAAAWAWKRIFPELTSVVDFWLFCETRPLITPSWNLHDDKIEVIEALGGTRTGLKHTAEVGSFIALWVSLYAMRRQKVSTDNWPRASFFASTHQGDDVCVSTRRPLDPVRWAAAFAEVGLKCDLIVGNGFLARHMLPNGTTAPIAGRVVQQTMSNEHEPLEGKPLGILYLGFLARTEGVTNLSPQWQDRIWSCLRHAKWIEESGAQTLGMLRNHLESADAKAIIKQSLLATLGQNWLRTEARDAEHAAAAKAAVDAAVALGLPVPQASGLDRVTDTLMSAIQQKDRNWRMTTALTGWSAVNSGNTSSLDWLRRIAEELGLAAELGQAKQEQKIAA